MLPPHRPLTEAERYPGLTEAGRALLLRMREHPSAPRFNHDCGDRLTTAGRQIVDEFERRQNAARQQGPPDWLEEFAKRCVREVPFYRERHSEGQEFSTLAPCSRADLSHEPWSFVPDGQPLDELIIYNTSGVTGHPLQVLSHPVVSSCYLPLLQSALALEGVRLEGGAGRVSIVLACHQGFTYTYASVSSFLDEAGFLKVNLNPAEWNSLDDPARYLDACNPEIYTGDPVSFLELARLPLQTKPKALVSTAMSLLPGMRQRLRDRFGCPVIDVYSMNECRLIGAGEAGRHRVIPHDLFVEILDPQGNSCAAGVRGEVTLTCARNPFLPLLRYRTGDFAALSYEAHGPVLEGLEGRRPVLFVTSDGRKLNSIDVSVALRPLALAQFQLRQRQDGSLLLRVRGAASMAEVESRVRELFGAGQQLEVAHLTFAEETNGKVLQYSTELSLPELA